HHYPGIGMGMGFGYGGTEMIYSYTVFNTKFSVYLFSADRYRLDRTEELLWIGQGQSSSESADRRSALACLLYFLFKNFLKDTGKGIEERIRLDDPGLRLLL
ncbi:MAG: hypothetical protein KJ645_11335, partial [Planctomycetes bacterium]|nr:hypothetical protein [Planctomycetota bacterium]